MLEILLVQTGQPQVRSSNIGRPIPSISVANTNQTAPEYKAANFLSETLPKNLTFDSIPSFLGRAYISSLSHPSPPTITSSVAARGDRLKALINLSRFFLGWTVPTN